MSDKVDVLSDEMVDQHLDAVLRASGSGLQNYSGARTRTAMRSALRAAMDHAVRQSGIDHDRNIAELIEAAEAFGDLPDVAFTADAEDHAACERFFAALANVGGAK